MLPSIIAYSPLGCSGSLPGSTHFICTRLSCFPLMRSKESYAAMAYASKPCSIALPAASVARLDTALVLIM